MVNIKKIARYISACIIFILINNINYVLTLAYNTKSDNKTVYLTFEDGPSINVTKQVINILNNNGVKATFFVVGDYASIYPYIMQELNENKMCIMPHCNIHDYKSIYKSEKSYFNDLSKCRDNIEAAIGESKLNFVRLPGGSNNSFCKSNISNEIQNKILSNGEYYIDWTISLENENLNEISLDFITSKIRDEGGFHNVEIINMSDSNNKVVTVESLQGVISFYKEKGYKFKTLNEIEDWEIQYLKDIGVINKLK